MGRWSVLRPPVEKNNRHEKISSSASSARIWHKHARGGREVRHLAACIKFEGEREPDIKQLNAGGRGHRL